MNPVRDLIALALVVTALVLVLVGGRADPGRHERLLDIAMVLAVLGAAMAAVGLFIGR